MEKVAIIGDTHFGRHARDQLTRDNIEKGQDDFFDFLIEDLKARGIKTVVFTGDIHDNRTFLNIKAAVKTKRLFQEKMKDFDIIIVQGNHDLYYKDSYEISSLMLFEDIPNVTIYQEKGKKYSLLGRDLYIVPWVIEEREENFKTFLESLAGRSKEAVENTIILGHFELSDVKMEGNVYAVNGMETKYLLNAARMTISGHYHGLSETTHNGNTLLYVGSPYPLTFVNANEAHGYYILSEDMSYEFVENTVSPRFTKITDEQILSGEVTTLSNDFVEVSYRSNMTDEEYLELTTKVDGLRPITKRYIPYNVEALDDKQKIHDALDEEEIPELSVDIADLACTLVDIRSNDEVHDEEFKDNVKGLIQSVIGKLVLS